MFVALDPRNQPIKHVTCAGRFIGRGPVTAPCPKWKIERKRRLGFER
jgi:hypothetical protein